MGCLVCGAACEVGALCRTCAQEVAPCDGLIQEHIRSTVAAMDAEAWLVDGFGAAHAVGEKSTIGRANEGQLVILGASVSRGHAELKQSDHKWTLRDLGSRNGTFVDGTRTQGRVTLPPRAKIKIGDVALWFLAEVAEEPAAPPTMETQSIGNSLVRYTLTRSDSAELCLVGGADTTSGGALLSRVPGTEKWAERALPPLEFQLLRALSVRALAESDSPAAVRGCVPTTQLARDLPFQSRYANDENVRQVVRRLRAALVEVGAEGTLAVVPGRGYYLTATVTATGADRR